MSYSIRYEPVEDYWKKAKPYETKGKKKVFDFTDVFSVWAAHDVTCVRSHFPKKRLP